MAIKALMLRTKIDKQRKALDKLLETRAELDKREAELEKAITEAADLAENADSEEAKAEADEAQEAVEGEVEKFEAEKAENDRAIEEAEKALEEREAELNSFEAEQEIIADAEVEERESAQPIATAENVEIDKSIFERRNEKMHTRDIFGKMNAQQRDALFLRDDVKGWIGEIRSHISEKRELTNVGLTIPEVFLGLLRQNIIEYSKLYKHVTVRPISGTGREVVMGSVPEGIWTECCGALNELSIGFNDAEVDCYKVGGFFKVCNAILEDSDVNLAAELLDAIGQAIGIALDKAILYGRNTSANSKMPMGIVSRLVQTSKPSGYPATARDWEDLHTSNIKATNNTGIQLFQDLVVNAGAAKGKYARGEKVFVMNEKTYTYLQAQAMSINAAGAIVSGMGGTMPVIGGIVEVLDFVPDNVIIGGYFELYLLAERGGTKFAQSEHAFFIQDQTAFKGTARYDGQPVIAEGFVALGVSNVTPDASMTFASDAANDVDLASITGLTLSPSFAAGTTTYTATTTNAKDAITAIASNSDASVKVFYTAGSTTTEVLNGADITWAAGSGNVVKIVVENGNSTKTYQITVTKN